MKFSVLLPTRNRLELLKQALFSILSQDFDDWEVIVFDNCSTEDIEGHVRSLHDPRIKYFRTLEFVSVTENWNNAIEKSSGDYILMLGDDDCLMKGYFKRMIQLLKDFPFPDFVYTSSFLYAYPGVLPWHPEGMLHAFGNAIFLNGKTDPFWLDKKEAARCVECTMNFRLQFSFNMQYSLIGREFYEKCKRNGKFFHSPYPDFYAMTLMMLKANRILAFPFPAVAIGISKRSYGYHYFNRQESEGVGLLNNASLKSEYHSLKGIVLPGSDMNTSWLMAMESLRMNESHLTVNYRQYQRNQIDKVYKDWATNIKGSHALLRELKRELRGRDRIIFGIGYQIFYFACKFLKKLLPSFFWKALRKKVLPKPEYQSQTIDGKFDSIQEVFEKIDPQAVMQASFLKSPCHFKNTSDNITAV